MLLVDWCNISHGDAVSKIGEVLAPSEVMAVFYSKGLETCTVGNGTFGGGSNGICTLPQRMYFDPNSWSLYGKLW
jgi:hypothetical protein